MTDQRNDGEAPTPPVIGKRRADRKGVMVYLDVGQLAALDAQVPASERSRWIREAVQQRLDREKGNTT